MRRDLILQNDAALRNCTVSAGGFASCVLCLTQHRRLQIYTSSERRVTASAEIFAAAFLDEPEDPAQEPLQLVIRKDLLDDSNQAKSEMDAVKKQLKAALKPDNPQAGVRPEHWPADLPPPVELCQQVAAVLKSLNETMLDNYKRLDVNKIQTRWCTHETPELFR